MELFRQEVFEARKVDKLGSIRIAPPKAGWIFFSGAVAVLISLIAVSVFGRYSRTESVSGRLVPASGQSSVIAPSTPGGIITEVLVREGQSVRRGQPLLKISGQRTSAALGDTGKIISDQLAQKFLELTQAIEAQKRIAELKQVELHGRIDLLRQRVIKLDDQIASQEQRYEAAKDLYETWRSRAAEVISGYQISQQYDTMLQQKSQAESLTDQRLQVMSDLAQANAELAQLPDTTRDRLAALSIQVADVQSAKAENEQTRELMIRAPNDGVIAGLLAHVGQPVSGTLSLMSVLPENTRLVAELWVPSRSVGLLKVGEPVSVGYEAFPAERYGWQRGTIATISRNSVSALELSGLLGRDEKESAYRVMVDIPTRTLPHTLVSTALKPGMTLSVKVIVENRRLIDWLIRPRQPALEVMGEDRRDKNG